MISAVFLNWSRSDMLIKVILPMLERCSCISEIVISHGRKETAFDYESRHCRMVHREDWEINKEWGIARRLVAAKEASNEIILQQDDDLLVPEETIEELLACLRRQPDVLHGLQGRWVDESLHYEAQLAYGDVPLLAGATALYRRDLAAKCFAPEYQEVRDFARKNTQPLWNVEDIFQSLVALHSSGSPNKGYYFPYFDLGFVSNQSDALSHQPQHGSNREGFLRYAVEKMGLEEKINQFACQKESHYIPPPPSVKHNWKKKIKVQYVRGLKRWIFYFLLRSRNDFIRRWILRRWAQKNMQRITGRTRTPFAPTPQ